MSTTKHPSAGVEILPAGTSGLNLLATTAASPETLTTALSGTSNLVWTDPRAVYSSVGDEFSGDVRCAPEPFVREMDNEALRAAWLVSFGSGWVIVSEHLDNPNLGLLVEAYNRGIAEKMRSVNTFAICYRLK